jgi:hypothetical protein
MESRGTLGWRILDAGSGSMSGRNGKEHPLYYPDKGKRIVRVDIGMPYPHRLSGNVLELQADIGHTRPDSLSQLRKLALIARHTGADLRTGPPQFDALIMVDILNYVDYRRTLPSLLPCLVPGGRLVVSNIPGMGLNEAFSPRRPRGNAELLGFLEEAGLSVEHLHFPPRSFLHPCVEQFAPRQYPSLASKVEEQGSMVLVAVK